MTSDLRLPDFLGIGAMKAATTYLDTLLRGHPELCLPAHVKEVQFFTRYFDRGPEWYASVFEGCGARRRGEISPQYLFDEACPARIASLLPDVKLLVSVRDPVERAYSQYKHWVMQRRYRHEFDTFLGDHPGTIARGEYFLLLTRDLDLFPREQIQVVVAEELIDDPRVALRPVFRFLGVDVELAPSRQVARENVSAVPRFHRLYVGTKAVTRLVYRMGGARIVHAAKRAGVPRVFDRGASDVAFAPLSDRTAERLRQHYADDVALLSRLVGRDLTSLWWGTNDSSRAPADT